MLTCDSNVSKLSATFIVMQDFSNRATPEKGKLNWFESILNVCK